MTEDDVTKIIFDTLNWAIGQAQCSMLLNLEIQDGGVVLFDTIEGQSFSMTIENIDV